MRSSARDKGEILFTSSIFFTGYVRFAEILTIPRALPYNGVIKNV